MFAKHAYYNNVTAITLFIVHISHTASLWVFLMIGPLESPWR